MSVGGSPVRFQAASKKSAIALLKVRFRKNLIPKPTVFDILDVGFLPCVASHAPFFQHPQP
eukprot:4223373-Prymnesium_polylepis.1